jgi:hypothetical protein
MSALQIGDMPCSHIFQSVIAIGLCLSGSGDHQQHGENEDVTFSHSIQFQNFKRAKLTIFPQCSDDFIKINDNQSRHAHKKLARHDDGQFFLVVRELLFSPEIFLRRNRLRLLKSALIAKLFSI